ARPRPVDGDAFGGSAIPGQVPVGLFGQPGVGGEVFFAQPDVLAQVLSGVRVDDVAQVVAVDAGAPGVPAVERAGHVPDLPAFAVLGPEGGGLVFGGAHRRPRSCSAISISVRSWFTEVARTTRGGLVRGRRA